MLKAMSKFQGVLKMFMLGMLKTILKTMPKYEKRPSHFTAHVEIERQILFLGGLSVKFTLKPPYSIAHDNLRLAIWDTSFWTFWLKFGHKGP